MVWDGQDESDFVFVNSYPPGRPVGCDGGRAKSRSNQPSFGFRTDDIISTIEERMEGRGAEKWEETGNGAKDIYV